MNFARLVSLMLSAVGIHTGNGPCSQGRMSSQLEHTTQVQMRVIVICTLLLAGIIDERSQSFMVANKLVGFLSALLFSTIEHSLSELAPEM